MQVTNEMMITNSLRRLSTRFDWYEQVQSQLAMGQGTTGCTRVNEQTGRGASTLSSPAWAQGSARSTASQHVGRAQAVVGAAANRVESAQRRGEGRYLPPSPRSSDKLRIEMSSIRRMS